MIINNREITRGEMLKMLAEKEERKKLEKETVKAFTETVKMYLELKFPGTHFHIKDYYDTIYGTASTILADDELEISLYPMDEKEKIVIYDGQCAWSYRNIREASLLIGNLLELI